MRLAAVTSWGFPHPGRDLPDLGRAGLRHQASITVCRYLFEGHVGEQNTGLNFSKPYPLPGFESMTNTLFVDDAEKEAAAHDLDSTAANLRRRPG
jgi:hypothetical protein